MREIGEKKNQNKLKLISFAIAIFVAVLITSAWWRLQSNPSEDGKRQFDASLEVVKTVATIAGGIVLYLNFRVAKEKLDQETDKTKNDAKLAEARLTMERFSKAVDMMGSDKSIHLRLGGIYALESIALDSSDDKIDENYRQVLEVLTAFVRENAKLKPEKESTIPSQPIEQPTAEVGEQHDEIPSLPTDIQAALTVLNRRKHKDTDWKQYSLDLRKTDLRRAYLFEANLQGANLQGANLQEANLEEANLEKANLEKVNLEKASLVEVSLQRANLQDANLQRANLIGGILFRTNLQRANLQGASLENAFLEAYLKEANLQGAVFDRANFRGADLELADLKGASLKGAKLHGTNLGGARLKQTDFCGAVLNWINCQGADLQGINFQGAILLSTDLHNTKNFNQGCLEGEKPPLLCNLALPDGCTTNPNRDCEHVLQALVDQFSMDFKNVEQAKQYVYEYRKWAWDV